MSPEDMRAKLEACFYVAADAQAEALEKMRASGAAVLLDQAADRIALDVGEASVGVTKLRAAAGRIRDLAAKGGR